MHDAKAGGFHAGHFQTPDGHVGAGVHMLAEHDFVVHLVDMVARQDDDIAGAVILDNVHVLVHGIGRAGIPHVLGHALGGRQHVKALVTFLAQEVPAARQVTDKAVRLILRRHRNTANARIDGIGQSKVDDARLAAEIDGRLGAPVGQFHQPRAAATGQHIGHCLTRQRRWYTIICHLSSLHYCPD